MKFPVIALVSISLLAPFASAQSGNQSRAQNQLSGGIGYFLPASSELQGIFGKSIFNYSVSPSRLDRPRAGRFSFDTSFINADRDGSKFFLAPFTYGYEIHFQELDSAKRGVVPFLRAEAGFAYMDYAINLAGGRQATKRFATTGAFEAGVVLNNAIGLSAKYHIFQKVDGINFNGLNLQLSIKFFSF